METPIPIVSTTAKQVRLGEILEAIPDAVLAVDAAGSVVLCNAHAAELFGYEHAAILGQPVEALLPIRFRAAHRTHRAGFAASGRRRPMGQGMELRALHRDGHEVEVEVSLNPVSLDGRPATLAIVRDVGNRNALTRALIESQEQMRNINAELELRIAERTRELRQANEELEAFSYSVAHDLRAPLRQIEGFARLLEEGLDESFSHLTARHLQNIRDGTHQMTRLITDLLDFSRFSRTEIRSEPTDLAPLVADAIRDLAPSLESRAIEWRVGALPIVCCDPSLVRVLFSNLLANAAKFTKPRACALIEVGVSSAKPVPVFFVRDNGVGFDMRYADKLFGVFQRFHSQDQFPGTGIGLATVQRVVSRHRGRIWALSAPEEGATFHFTLCEGRPAEGEYPDE